ncbi:family 16 glycoside hydrolase [Parapedobacter sp. 2B3]|uniref:family 16 glycoside hydrolase n=1 Tax=Parapedobacter sp. 2B3 TaxID=3342381 RepID=UPI0035B5B9C2
MNLLKFFSKSFAFTAHATLLLCLAANAQTQVFTTPAKGWESVGSATVPLSKQQVLMTSPGDGILVHASDRKGRPEDLVTATAYGDIELAFNYLLAEGAEATLYLHGVYPVTLADSRGVATPTALTNGGAAGYPPRQQVGRAPGLWQRMHIQFRAPRFDGNGQQIAPARLLRAELNGVIIHEDVQLQAPEKANGNGKAAEPVRLAVSRGAVALKDVTINKLAEAADSRDRNGADPILVSAQVNTTLRSFMDVPDGPRVVHAISVGHPAQVHYTYDLDKGNLFQVWRGGFLDATPMWNNRGNGTSRVLGSPVHFGVPSLAVGKLVAADNPWPADTAGTGYKPNGYVLDAHDLPTFRYVIYGQQATDAIRPLTNGEGFTRTITVNGNTDGLYLRLAVAPTIVDQGKGVFLIGDNRWYLRIEETGKAKPFVRDQPTGKELLVPVTSITRYSIIF